MISLYAESLHCTTSIQWKAKPSPTVTYIKLIYCSYGLRYSLRKFAWKYVKRRVDNLAVRLCSVYVRRVRFLKTIYFKEHINFYSDLIINSTSRTCNNSLHYSSLCCCFYNWSLFYATNLQEDFGEVKADEAAAVHLPTPTGGTQWRIRGFAVAAKMRSKGLGTKLIEACVRMGRERQGKQTV